MCKPGGLLIYFSLLGCLAGTGISRAQTGGIKLSTGMEAPAFSLEYDESHFEFTGQLAILELKELTGTESYVKLSIPGYFHSGIPGGPALPQKSVLFEAGEQEDPAILILSCDSMVFDLEELGFDNKLLPYQASQQKGRAQVVFPAREDLYALDDWTGSELIELSYEGIMRGVSMSRLAFNPVRYNPYRKQIKVYYNVHCLIETDPGVGDRRSGPRPGSLAFQDLFKRVVIQQKQEIKKALEVEQAMTLVILSDTLFREKLQPLVEWKRSKGFRVVEAYTQDPAVGGSRSSIKSYLEALYLHPPQEEELEPPSFLLIVGDVEQIPLSQATGQITDLYYATYDGPDDYIPDLFYGRISVANTDQLEAVLEKLLEYEQYAFPDPSFLDESILIAGVDGSFAPRHGNGQISYATDHYFNESHGLNAHAFYYPESDSSDQKILDLISAGVGFVNYTGHGLHDQWINPNFHQNDIGELMNKGRYPVIVGNGCETNVFTLGECFAEALLRAPEKGALAYIGCTNDSYWDEDYYWSVGVGPIVADPRYEDSSPGFYDRVFHTHGEDVALWSPSLGEMIFGGNMSVQESNSSRKKFYWEIYQLAGDPSLVPWFGEPVQRMVSHPRMLPAGTGRLDISCAPGDYVALSWNGLLLDAAHASRDGLLAMHFPDTLGNGHLDLVVSGDRFIPYLGRVDLGEYEGSYLDLLNYTITGESRGVDGRISQDERFSLDLQLINRGNVNSGPDTLVLVSRHPYVIVLDSLLILQDLEAGDTLYRPGVFSIISGAKLRDQESVMLQVFSRKDTLARAFNLKEKIVAPVLVSRGITWDDRDLGNGNGIADAGEWLLCKWDLRNTGHLASGELSLPVAADDASQIRLLPGEQITLSFQLRVEDSWTELRSTGPLVTGDKYNILRDSVIIYPGRHFEDFSYGKEDRYAFINSFSSPWQVDSQFFHSAPYALRSGFTGDNEQSEIAITLEIPERDSLFFSFRVSSEEAYDFLLFMVDSVLIRRWSGELAWSTYSHELEPGRHRVRWVYVKDENLAMGEDAAWIDDLGFPSRAFSKQDLSLTGILSPVSGPWLTDSEEFSVKVRNTGTDTLNSFRATLFVEGKELSSDSFALRLVPGQEIQVSLTGSADLSVRQSYGVLARITHPRDNFPGNNSKTSDIVHYDFPDLSLNLEGIEETDGVRLDANVLLRNEGNTRIDSFCYELWVNDSLLEEGCRFIGLDAGGAITSTFKLADSSRLALQAAYIDFLLRSVVPDSVAGNNELEGRQYWQVQGKAIPDLAVDIKLYPNPASQGVHLNFSGPVSHRQLIHVLDKGGRRLASYILPAGQDHLYIPLQGVSPGSYLLKLENTGITLPLLKAE
jgi:hypothetical protein